MKKKLLECKDLNEICSKLSPPLKNQTTTLEDFDLKGQNAKILFQCGVVCWRDGGGGGGGGKADSYETHDKTMAPNRQ